ncbi:DMT family transporter [Leptolyngbya iicbica]|uniref:DMT family transporter n=2 Tax=Cyanophyceae TaxID=3028117 RepID=A0A4Q7EAF7_9CYAN|nr:DMT family transporter [Leptolyngbya sp. LK]RZM77975.1 DMT family transporter [Leptolyngbya sp. LK]
MLRGEIAALTAAFLWALSTVIFGRLGKSLSPLVLNLAKGGIAIALIVLTLVIQQNLQPQLPPAAIFWLMLSGVVGIGLGDTAYFKSINHLGARRALLMETLAPPLTALIALIFLQERLGAIAWCGIVLTVGGIAWVISERVPAADQYSFNLKTGLLWSVLAQLGQASGAVMSRGALANTTVDPLWSGLLRIAAGAIVLVILVSSRGSIRQQFIPLRSRQLLPLLGIAAFLGTYLAIWLQQIAFKFTPAGIAQALLATSPLFVLPIAASLGDRITGRAVLGVMIAIAGIWLLIGTS